MIPGTSLLAFVIVRTDLRRSKNDGDVSILFVKVVSNNVVTNDEIFAPTSTVALGSTS